jgi:hypothetical protein
MNVAIGGLDRPMIWRKSKAYRKQLFKKLLMGLPVVGAVGWEYRVWKRNLYFERNRENFPGSTPFYGKQWGYEADYMIETSLNDGDLVFWQVDPLSIHIHEAFARFAHRHLNHDYDSWDLCGIVKKDNGRAYVIGPNKISTLYSDLVADSRTTTLAVRRRISESSFEIDFPHNSQFNFNLINFFENSIKTISSNFQIFKFLNSIIREDSLHFPINHLTDGHLNPSKPVIISDVFSDPMLSVREGVVYSPPFFVRRFDNEYYNHNRTKNIVVDWKLLTERESRNRFVSKHNDDNRS